MLPSNRHHHHNYNVSGILITIMGAFLSLFFPFSCPSPCLLSMGITVNVSYILPSVMQNTIYVSLLEGDQENPLLDSRFPDVSGKGRGYLIQAFPTGLPEWEELRKISIWQTVSALEQVGIDCHLCVIGTVICVRLGSTVICVWLGLSLVCGWDCVVGIDCHLCVVGTVTCVWLGLPFVCDWDCHLCVVGTVTCVRLGLPFVCGPIY